MVLAAIYYDVLLLKLGPRINWGIKDSFCAAAFSPNSVPNGPQVRIFALYNI